MKKINYLTVFCLMMAMFCAFFTSCKDDDDNDKGNANALYGVWKTISQDITYPDGEIETIDVDEQNYQLFTFSDKLTIIEYEDGIPGEPEIQNITISGNKIKNSEGEWTYSISGDTLTMTAEAVEDGIKIKAKIVLKKVQ